ncbi:MAG: hypothetical protein ACRBF0_22210 [Calditrichia bacterium]
MKKNQAGAFFIGLGSVTVVAGLVQYFIGADFFNYSFTIFIGVTLCGIASLLGNTEKKTDGER